MKKIFIFLFTLLLHFPMLAGEISPEKARETAEEFFSKDPSSTRGAACKLTLVNAEEVARTRSGSTPAFYIFNREGGGFVIISAVDQAKQILGYSFENTFGPMDEMPENLSEWLDEYRWQINEWRASGKESSETASTRSSDSYGGGKDLGTPDWGQGTPFNNKCPLDSNGKRTLVGCTNTAISELMYYHKYPSAGSGTLPSYTKNGITVPSITLGEKYDWSNMLQKYSGVSYTDTQADAASTLCQHVATMSKSSFGVKATSASTTNAVPLLTTYFGYDNGFTSYSSSLFSYDDWRNLLVECIDDGFPLLYTGYSNSGSGHCFIVDGYDNGGRILINFGWNASSNGYYEIGSFGKYFRTNRCWIYVRPEAGGTDNGYMTLKASSSGNYRGLNYVSGTPESGGSIYIKFGYITWNSNGCTFTGEINFRLLDKDGNDKGWLRSSTLEISSELASGKSLYWSSNLKLKIPSSVTIEKGDYIEAYYRKTGSSEWKAIKYQDSELSIIGRIYCHIADFTSMEFDTSSRELVFTTFSNASYTLSNSSGSSVSKGVSFSDGVLTIDTTQLASGKYTVTFSSGGNSTSISFKI